MKRKSNSFGSGAKTLILIDVQRDFLPGGPLAVPGGDQIIGVINSILPLFGHVIATQDWHPPHHISFSEWPEHCVQNTKGAELAPALNQKPIEKIFRKGVDLHVDSYSAFFDNERLHASGLEKYLKKNQLQTLYFAGLASDYCVLYSVLDALALGFEVFVIQDACRAIGDEKKAFSEMRAKGAKLITSEKIKAS